MPGVPWDDFTEVAKSKVGVLSGSSKGPGPVVIASGLNVSEVQLPRLVDVNTCIQLEIHAANRVA